MDRRAKTRDTPAMLPIGTTKYPDLDAVLTRLGVQRTTEKVHALFLGALTSTSLRRYAHALMRPPHRVGKGRHAEQGPEGHRRLSAASISSWRGRVSLGAARS